MKNRFEVLTNRKTVVCLMSLLLSMAFGSHTLQAQIKFNEANEIREANMGIERVARYYIPAYSSKQSVIMKENGFRLIWAVSERSMA